MAKGACYGSERRILQDEETGVTLIRLSGFPTINTHVYMHSRCFTFDSRDAVFYSNRLPSRDSPRDIFAVSTDGLRLRQLTDREGVGWMTCSPVERSVFYACGRRIFEVSVDTFEEEEVVVSDLPHSIISVSKDGSRICSYCNSEGEGIVSMIDVKKKSSEVVYRHPSPIGHLQLEPSSSKRIIFHDTGPAGSPRIWCVDCSGSDARVLYDDRFGPPSHFVWLPGRDLVVSTLQHPHRGIVLIDIDGGAELLTEEHAFWHAGASPDGEMLCSDTFNPDTGMYLVDVESGRARKLCNPRSSNSHPQWTHPHPSWSPDGSMILFNSDREGTPQVYLCRVPQGLKAQCL